MGRLARLSLAVLALTVPSAVEADELTAVVAARMIHGGEIVSRDALAVLAVRSAPAPGFVATVDEATGRVARRTLVRGRLIPRDALRAPDVVTKGSLVDLRWRSGALTLRVPATALRSGRVGARVAVRVPATDARLSARVVAPGVVEAVR